MQVKGLMPLWTAQAEKHPPAEPLGEIGYGITFSAVSKVFMLLDSIIVFTISQKNEDILWHLSSIEYPQLYFV